MSAAVSGETDLQAKLDQAVELREDGDLAESAELFEAIFADGIATAVAAAEYAKTLRKLDRFADADRVLAAAMAASPSDFDLARAWAELPRHQVNYQETIARGRILRERFPPSLNKGAWESLSVELDCYYEMGDWHALEEALGEHWDDFVNHPEMLPHGIAAMNKLFLMASIDRLVAAATAEAWTRLPDGARAHLLARTTIAKQNSMAIAQSNVMIISIGQNCLPYQLSGRWGLMSAKADPGGLTPFDLGGFTNDTAADAIATDFAAFGRREDYVVTKAWGGGSMFTHQPTGVGFFHERGSHWVTPDRGRFLSKISLMMANWQLAKQSPRRLFVFCYCGAGDLAKLVRVAAENLLSERSHLLVIDVQQQRHDCPVLPNVTYRHVPYPRNYDWTSVYQQCSEVGLRTERAIVEAIGRCIVLLEPAARDILEYLPMSDSNPVTVHEHDEGSAKPTRLDLISNSWRFSNSNGNVLGERFTFSEDGLVEDYQNDNEASWRLEDGVLKIFKRNGDLMWTAASVAQADRGPRQIRLQTHLNPALDFYLTEIEPRPGLSIAAPPQRYTGALSVLLLSNGLDIERRLADILIGATIIRIGDIADIDNHPDCNVFICGLVLSHADRPEAGAAIIERITGRFALSMFFELSGHGAEYLNRFGLRSFHRDFRENAGVDVLNLDFVAASVAKGVYKIEHFAETPAFDSFKDWVVSEAHPRASRPSAASRGDYRVFEQPVFEFSIYVCHRFDALDVNLQGMLALLEMRLLRFRGESSGFRLNNRAHPRELGRLLYNTQENASAALRTLPVSTPIFVEDAMPERPAAHEEILKKWRAETKIEIADLSVFALENCVVGGTGTIFCKDKFVSGTDYLLMFLNSSSLDPIMRGLQTRHPMQHVDGVAIVGFNALYDNYYHWVAEAMAAISLCIDLLDSWQLPRITIITGKLNKFRSEYLEILLQGDPRYQIVELDRTEFITADTVIYCDNVGRVVHQQVCWEEVPFAGKVIASLGLKKCEATRMIYVARSDTAGRVLRNEADVIARLQSIGFEIFVGGRHSVAEQVKTFREARLVVAPHGAGLTNLLFCQAGTVVIEWQQSGYFNTGMMRLAQVGNLNYQSQMYFPTESDDFSFGWEIDIDRAVALIEQLR